MINFETIVKKFVSPWQVADPVHVHVRKTHQKKERETSLVATKAKKAKVDVESTKQETVKSASLSRAEMKSNRRVLLVTSVREEKDKK
jgi:hypothetical protein